MSNPEIMMRKWVVKNYGLTKYQTALGIQKKYWKKTYDDKDHYLLFFEHYPVITLGRRTNQAHILSTDQEIQDQGIEICQVDRGGSATYHAPGQQIGYIICKVSRVGGIHKLISTILKSIKTSFTSLGIPCYIDNKNPGIWTDTLPPKKLVAVGMQVKDGISMHGFAVNVDLALNGFSFIVPCGLELPVSTLSLEKNATVDIELYREKLQFILVQQLIELSNKQYLSRKPRQLS